MALVKEIMRTNSIKKWRSHSCEY